MNSKFRKTILGVFGGILVLFLSFLVSTSSTEKKINAAAVDTTAIVGGGPSTFCIAHIDFPNVCVPKVDTSYNGVELTSSTNNVEQFYGTLQIYLSNTGSSNVSFYTASTTITKTKAGVETTVASNISGIKIIDKGYFNDFATYKISVKIGYKGVTGTITSASYTLAITNTSAPSITYNGVTYTESKHLFKNNLSGTHTISVAPQFEIKKCLAYDYFTESRDGITSCAISREGPITVAPFKDYSTGADTTLNRVFALTLLTEDRHFSAYIKITNTVTGEYIDFSIQFSSTVPVLKCVYPYSSKKFDASGTLDKCGLQFESAVFDRSSDSTISILKLNGKTLTESEFFNRTKALANGLYEVYVKDLFGNAKTYTFNILNERPEVSITRGVTTNGSLDSNYSKLTGTISDNSGFYSIKMTIDGVSTFVDCDNKKSYNLDIEISDVERVQIIAIDNAGNSITKLYVRDTTPPVLDPNFKHVKAELAPGPAIYVNVSEIMYYVNKGTIGDNMCFVDVSNPAQIQYTIRSASGTWSISGKHCIENSMMETLIVDRQETYVTVEASDIYGNVSTTAIYFDYQLPKLYSYSRYTSVDDASINYVHANILTDASNGIIYFEDGKTYELGAGYTWIYASDDVGIKSVYDGTKLLSKYQGAYQLTSGNNYTIRVTDDTGNSIVVYFKGMPGGSAMTSAQFNDSYDSNSIEIIYETTNSDMRKHKFVVSYYSIVKSPSSSSYTYVYDFEFMMYADYEYSYGIKEDNKINIALPDLDEFRLYRTKRVSMPSSSFTETNFIGNGPYYHDILNTQGCDDIETLLSAYYGSLSTFSVQHFEAAADSEYFVLVDSTVVQEVDQKFTVNGSEVNDAKYGGNGLDLNLKVSLGKIETLQICQIPDRTIGVDCSKSSNVVVDATVGKSTYTVSVDDYDKFTSGMYLAYIVDSLGFYMTRSFYLDIDGPMVKAKSGLTYDISNGVVVITDKYDPEYSLDFIDSMSKINTNITYDIYNPSGYMIEWVSGVTSLAFGKLGQTAPINNWMTIELKDVYDEYGNGVLDLTIYLYLSNNPSEGLFNIKVDGQDITSVGVYKDVWRDVEVNGYIVPWNGASSGFNISVEMVSIANDSKINALRLKNEQVIIDYKRTNGTQITKTLTSGNYQITTEDGYCSVLNNMVTVAVYDLNGLEHIFKLLFVNPDDTSIEINNDVYDGKTNILMNTVGFDWTFPKLSAIETIKIEDNTEEGSTFSSSEITGSMGGPNRIFFVTLTTIFGDTEKFSITLDTIAPVLYSGSTALNTGGEFANTSYRLDFNEYVKVDIYGVYAPDLSDFGNASSFANPKFQYDMEFVRGDSIYLLELLGSHFKVGHLLSLKLVLKDAIGNSSSYYLMVSNGFYVTEEAYINCITVNDESYCVNGQHVSNGHTYLEKTIYEDISIEYPENPVVEGFSRSANLFSSLEYIVDSKTYSLEEDELIEAPNNVDIVFTDIFGNVLTLKVKALKGFDFVDNEIYGIGITTDRLETLPSIPDAIYYVASGTKVIIDHIEEITVDCYKHNNVDDYELVHDAVNGGVYLSDGLWKIKLSLGADSVSLYIYVSSDPMMDIVNVYTDEEFELNTVHIVSSSNIRVKTLYGDLKTSFYSWLGGAILEDYNEALYDKNGEVKLVLSYDNIQVSGSFNVKLNNGVGPSLPNIPLDNAVYDSDTIENEIVGEVTWIAAKEGSTVDLEFNDDVSKVIMVELFVGIQGNVTYGTDTECSNNVCSFSNEGLYLVQTHDNAGNISEHHVAIMLLTPEVAINSNDKNDGYYYQERKYTSSIKSNNVTIKNVSFDGGHYKVEFDKEQEKIILKLVNTDGILRGSYSLENLNITFGSTLPEIGTVINVDYHFNHSNINLFDVAPTDFMKTAIEYSTDMSFDNITTSGLPMTDVSGQTLFSVSKERKTVTTLSSGPASLDTNVLSLDLEMLFSSIEDEDIKEDILGYSKKGFVSTNTFDSEEVIHEGLYRHGIILDRSSDNVIKLDLINVGKEYKDAVFGLKDLEVPIKVDISDVDFGGIEEIDSNNSFENKGLITLGVWKEELFFESKKTLL